MFRPLLMLGCFCCVALPSLSQADEPVSFAKQVAPILIKNCQGCHGATDPKGDYRLHTFELFMKAGESGQPAIAGKSLDNSYLYSLLIDEDPDVRMPKDAKKLPDDQLALIRKWIEEGAKFDGPDLKATLTSFAPRPAHPLPPEIYPVAMPVTALAFRPDGKELAVGSYHEITLWNPDDGKLVRRIQNVAERTYGLAYNPDGKLLAAASGTPGQLGEVKLFNPQDGSLVKDLGATTDTAFHVAFSPDGKRLAACAADRSIRVFDVESGSQQLLIEDHADWVMCISWSPDGKQLVSASRDKTSKVFNAENGESQATYPGHGQPVYAAVFSADGKQILSAGGDKQVHVWNLSDGKRAANIGGYGGEVFGLLRVGDQLFSCSGDKTAKEHGAEKRNQVRIYAGHQDWVYAIDYNDPAKKLATGTYDGEDRIFNTTDGKEILKFKPAPGLPTTSIK